MSLQASRISKVAHTSMGQQTYLQHSVPLLLGQVLVVPHVIDPIGRAIPSVKRHGGGVVAPEERELMQSKEISFVEIWPCARRNRVLGPQIEETMTQKANAYAKHSNLKSELRIKESHTDVAGGLTTTKDEAT